MAKKQTPKQIQTDIAELENPAAAAEPVKQEFKVISLDLIDDPEQAMRTNITAATVEDLVLSIKQVGLIEPIVVKPKNGRYEVIAGHRRKFAHEIAKIPTIQCYVRNVTTDESEMMKIHENLYREDIRPTDEARHFENMMKVYKMTPPKIAQLIGKSETYVHDRLDIFQYPEYLKDALNKKQVSFSVAREFFRVGDPQTIIRFTHYAVRNGMTAETAKQWVNDHKKSLEQPQIIQNTVSNGLNGEQEIESSTQCIFCKQGLKLLESSVVYMHPKCVDEANLIQPETPALQQN